MMPIKFGNGWMPLVNNCSDVRMIYHASYPLYDLRDPSRIYVLGAKLFNQAFVCAPWGGGLSSFCLKLPGEGNRKGEGINVLGG